MQTPRTVKLMVGLKWIGFGVLTGILVGGVSALFAKASRAAIGTPPMAAMRMPEPISVMRASAPLTSA